MHYVSFVLQKWSPCTQVVKTFVAQYRAILGCFSVEQVVDNTLGDSVSSDVLCWAPFLFALKQWPSVQDHTTSAGDKDFQQWRETGRGSIIQHLEAKINQDQMMKNIDRFAESWQAVPTTENQSELHGQMADLANQCRRAATEDTDRFVREVSEFFNQIFRHLEGILEEVCHIGSQSVEDLLMTHAKDGLPAELHDDILQVANTKVGKSIFTEMKWFWSDSFRELRSRLTPVTGDPIHRNPVMVRAGTMAASFTAIQSLWRPLKEGEERDDLISRCFRAITADNKKDILFIAPSVYVTAHKQVIGLWGA